MQSNLAATPASEKVLPVLRLTHMPAEITEEGSCALGIVIEGIGRTEVAFWAGFRLKPDRRAKLTLPLFAPMWCTITWSADWRGGAVLEQPLDPAVLRHLLMIHPPSLSRLDKSEQ